MLSRVSFGVTLCLSSLLTLLLLVAFSNVGFGPLIAAGPAAMFIAAVMLLNPLVFGLLGTFKASPLWRLVAAGAMTTLLLLYGLEAYGYFGPIGV